MLIEEQASVLLERCETLLGKELRAIRGNLRKAGTRAAAVWELVVLDAVANIGPIEHEPLNRSSPDILLHLPNCRSIWIEVTYLYPRFWKKEIESNQVLNWLISEIKRRGIPPDKISIWLDGEQELSGRIRNLPNDKKKFLNEPELLKLYDHIASNPNDSYACCISPYTIFISYNPNDQGLHCRSSRFILETSASVQEHAVYRKLKDKARQHNVREPLVICVGSDQSYALSRIQSHPSYYDAVNAAFLKHHSLSAVIVVAIELKPVIFEGVKRYVRADLLINQSATNPLTIDEIQLLRTINFNRWNYVRPLEKYENNTSRMRRITGSLIGRYTAMGIEIEIPANIVVDALAGKTSLAESYNLTKDYMFLRAINEGWIIKSCRMKEENIEAGEAAKIVIELVPPRFAAFWTKDSKS